MRSPFRACLLAALALSTALPSKASERPNIVIILADDLGFGDLRSYNPQSQIPTPKMDRLADEGMRFTDAHTPSSVCTPTRYGLLTGRYSWRGSLKSGVLWGYDPLLIESGRETIASFLKKEGYFTACIGKWHLGLGASKPVDYSKPLTPGPNAVGFDYFFGIPASLDMEPYVYVENERVTAPPSETIAESKHQRNGGKGMWRGGPIAPGFRHVEVLPRLVEKSTGFLRERKSDQPFLLYLPLTSPHTPWLPSEKVRGRTRAGDYGDFVAQTDDCVGSVLQALDETGLAANTLVILTSDNGSHWPASDVEKWGHKANGDWRGQKADIWEAGHRVPFIVRWPGKVQAGATSSALICLTDIFSTLQEVTDKQPVTQPEDSQSFLPVLLGKTKDARADVVHHSIDGTFAIREGAWKLIEGLGSHGFSMPKTVAPQQDGPQGQLYHLGDDPGETRNLWLERPEIVERLTALLEKRKQQGESAVPR